MTRLSGDAREAIESLLAILATDPNAPTSVRRVAEARDAHVADSLSGLEVDRLVGAGRIADLGSGAGFPGLVLAAALPGSRVDLIESISRRCDYLDRAVAATGLANAKVVRARSEEWAAGEGREAYDAVTARAVGRLSTLAELSSPLLHEDGVLVAWKGRRVRKEEAEARRAAERLAMEPLEVRPVRPYAGSRDRHIHLLRKNGPTPEGLPRRAGMAAKRPFGAK